jgi:nucleoside-diphosphate-sugar epimerase
MKLLVTGGGGAIGKRLVQKLKDLGHEPVSYDIAQGQDLFDLPKLEAAIAECDAVYHLAAQANLNYMRTLEGARDGIVLNVSATEQVARLCAQHKKWLLFVSTMCVYGDTTEHPENEDTTLPNPSEIYAASKYAAEWLVRGYGKSFGLEYTILRIATVYGPGCRPELGVHVFFNQALKGEPITVHGDGSQERSLTYVDDVVDGCAAALGRPAEAKGQIFNITGAERISAISMANQIKELTQSASEIRFVPQRPHNTQFEHPDVTKARELLGWEAKVPFSEGLKKTLEWLRGV